MQSIERIRAFINRWQQLTYAQGLDYCYAIKNDTELYDITVQVLRMQQIEQKKMDGNSVQNIPIKNEGKIDIIFSDIFWRLTEGYMSPASYVGTIVKECVENDINNVFEIAGIVGRGLRAFPSFLREMDLTYKFAKYFPNATVINNPEQDVIDHTDIYIKSNNYDYRIWSYQNFERGLKNTASRLRGYRGTVPEGIHVLCPIDISNEFEREEISGWFFYSERYVSYLYEMIIIEKPDEYSLISEMNDYTIEAYLRKANKIKK